MLSVRGWPLSGSTKCALMPLTSRPTIVLGLARWMSWSIVVASRSLVSSISLSREDSWSWPTGTPQSTVWGEAINRRGQRSGSGHDRARVEAEGQLEAVRAHQRLVGEHVVRRAVGHDRPAAEHHRAGAQLEGVGQVVGDHQDGDVQRAEDVGELAARGRVE